jgi:L-seryl-tRNA(Ser) seleniumtransferase
MVSSSQQKMLRKLPGVDQIFEITKTMSFIESVPKSVIVNSIRDVLEKRRKRILAADMDNLEESLSENQVIDSVKETVAKTMALNLRHLVNATGVVVHTNLGRSLLPGEVVENISRIASRYSNLEYDLVAGTRGSRYSVIEDIICEISGAPAALVVNNNAGAVLLCLDTIARGREVVISRGELVEIGGSFRIPDVMAKSGGILKEVGTTNRTHMMDYENAINDKTALLLKVHRSNYSVVGFTAEVSLKELVEMGHRRDIVVMEDLGSGTFIDFSKYGLVKEPTVQESVAAGADVVTFSGDKLLGGPQAGIIVGRAQILERIKKNPIARALRIDKMTLAALESTIRLYRDEAKAVQTIPTLRMLTMNIAEIEHRALELLNNLMGLNDSRIGIDIVDLSSKAGGGALPFLELPSKCLRIKIDRLSANVLESKMRNNSPPIIGRIEDDAFIIDPRTLRNEDLPIILSAFNHVLKRAEV